ncbi:MAG: LytTR family DNA-binding domain-containing protein [Wenzhouxiangellaceae bacterium]|nr:LytTR family DNA-binding domain-containing protein [Wenzhouxiangellaceae bacterium]
MSTAEDVSVMIVDDEPLAVERLSRQVSELAGFRVGCCESRPERVIERIRQARPDVLLLDIEMPGRTGLDLARACAGLEERPAVIFVTAHDDFALDAFDVAAVDYLVKPVRTARLAQALERARRRSAGAARTGSARRGERRIRLPLDRVRAALAEDKCTVVHTTDGPALCDLSLKDLEAQHGAVLLRCHRSALVHRHHLRSLYRDADGVERVEIDGVDVRPEVSRRSRAAIVQEIRGE